MDTLQALLAYAVQGRGQVVGIMGEPGMGKSRLLYEFAQRLAEKPVTYMEGHCLSDGQYYHRPASKPISPLRTSTRGTGQKSAT